ncbi:hypothetical protein AURANDRAFT_67305 [Aureococcus anophagefferens]|uniref:Carrier domain-containing protein n=1 Tax=Aureococcus anophagefferens TaxID=44056 RepID=F0YKQ1_AURAN|nr:hypothetical protein AURANDRAFT_67305 [Aureococcus anophagefferens]EGB04273.1 hypothetical protein AURANDRAFT_67305 [Aureococcus anophagefferens]|eukprot:XP_009040983.1 hypothetical protein AURANDRAFT_67305 [Aureococcus anophagefferens]
MVGRTAGLVGSSSGICVFQGGHKLPNMDTRLVNALKSLCWSARIRSNDGYSLKHYACVLARRASFACSVVGIQNTLASMRKNHALLVGEIGEHGDVRQEEDIISSSRLIMHRSVGDATRRHLRLWCKKSTEALAKMLRYSAGVVVDLVRTNSSGGFLQLPIIAPAILVTGAASHACLNAQCVRDYDLVVSSLIAILGVACENRLAINVCVFFDKNDYAPDTIILGNEKLVHRMTVTRGPLTFAAALSLRDISSAVVCDVQVAYTCIDIFARADSLEMSRTKVVDTIYRENKHRAQLINRDALLLPTANVNWILRSPTISMFAALSPAPRSDPETVTLMWNNMTTALLELDDPSTFNAMTPSLLENLGRYLTAAFAFTSIRALVLQASGPHFCTGGRYNKNASSLPPWWIKAQGGSSIGGGLLLALATDYRVATRSAIFRLGVAPYGLSPVVMATTVLPEIVGYIKDETTFSRASTLPTKGFGRLMGTTVSSNVPLMDAGFDSLAASELVEQLSSEFNVDLPTTLLFDHPSIGIDSLAASELVQQLSVSGVDSSPLVLRETSSNGLTVVLTLNRPRVFNGAFGMEMALAELMNAVAEEPKNHACVVTGRGRVYQVAEHRNNREHASTRDYLAHYFNAFINFSKPVVAALNGSAYGGAATSTSHCDHAIAIEEAELSFPFKRWGVVAEGNSTVYEWMRGRFPWLVVYQRAVPRIASRLFWRVNGSGLATLEGGLLKHESFAYAICRGSNLGGSVPLSWLRESCSRLCCATRWSERELDRTQRIIAKRALEAHGTGTALGDPIEVVSSTDVKCVLGSFVLGRGGYGSFVRELAVGDCHERAAQTVWSGIVLKGRQVCLDCGVPQSSQQHVAPSPPRTQDLHSSILKALRDVFGEEAELDSQFSQLEEHPLDDMHSFTSMGLKSNMASSTDMEEVRNSLVELLEDTLRSKSNGLSLLQGLSTGRQLVSALEESSQHDFDDFVEMPPTIIFEGLGGDPGDALRSLLSFDYGQVPGALTGHSAGFLSAAVVATGIDSIDELMEKSALGLAISLSSSVALARAFPDLRACYAFICQCDIQSITANFYLRFFLKLKEILKINDCKTPSSKALLSVDLASKGCVIFLGDSSICDWYQWKNATQFTSLKTHMNCQGNLAPLEVSVDSDLNRRMHSASHPPESDLVKIRSLCCKVGMQLPSDESNFFMHGLTSVGVFQLISLVRHEFDASFTPEHLKAHPTIMQLAGWYTVLKNALDAASLLQIGVWRITRLERVLFFFFHHVTYVHKYLVYTLQYSSNRISTVPVYFPRTSFYPLSIPNMIMSTISPPVPPIIVNETLPALVASLERVAQKFPIIAARFFLKSGFLLLRI